MWKTPIPPALLEINYIFSNVLIMKVLNKININKGRLVLVLNIFKTNYILFRFSWNKNDFKNAINLKSTQINYMSSAKFLGIKMDGNLGCSCHVNNLCGNLSKPCFALKELIEVVN